MKEVDTKFDGHGIPHNLVWLDLRYNDGRKYFMRDTDYSNFDEHAFTTRCDTSKGRNADRLTLNKTAHYPVFDELKRKNLTIKDKEGPAYEG